MADKDLIIRERMDHSGLFDFAALYSFAHSWFKEEGYGIDETRYSEKVKGDARDITIEWRIIKTLSDYFKIEHSVKFEIKGLTEVEAEIDGTRKKMNRGSVAIEIRGTLIKDPESKWETSAFMRFSRDIYNKYIIPARIVSMRERVSGDVQDFKEE